MYTSLVSSCDCTAGDSFVYTVWIAKPKQVEEWNSVSVEALLSIIPAMEEMVAMVTCAMCVTGVNEPMNQ